MPTRIAFSAALALAVTGHAQPYIAFSPGTNPTGDWSYGWKSTPSGALTLFDHPFHITPDMPAWTGFQLPSSSPLVAFNPLYSAQTVPGTSITVPLDTIWFQIGPAGELPVFRWTAPAPGQYQIRAWFAGLDAAASAPHRASILIDTTTAFSADIPPGGNAWAIMHAHVAQGEFVDLQVGAISTPLHGSYSVSASIAPETCYANCADDHLVPFLNINDFICFQALFASALGLPQDQQRFAYPNCDGSTTPPVLTVNDFLCFQHRFAAGCSAP